MSIKKYNILRLFENKLQIFVYHHILKNDKSGLEKYMNTDLEIFKKQVLSFKKRGYIFLTMEDVFYFSKDEKSIPKKSVAITFDDGYIDLYENVYPFLKEEGIKASVFIIQNMVGKKGYMNENQIKEVDECVKCYSHGYEHINFGLEEKNKLKTKEEIISYAKKPIDYLNELLGENKPYIFCYPYGAFTSNTEMYLKESGVFVIHTDNKVNSLKEIKGTNRVHREYILEQGYIKTYLKKLYRYIKYRDFKDENI